MEKKRPSEKKLVLLVFCLLAVLAAAGLSFLNRTPGYENGVRDAYYVRVIALAEQAS